MKRAISLLVLVGAFVVANATSYKVNTTEEFQTAAKKVVAGDSIVLRSGVWTDAALTLKHAQGTEEAPITVTVEEKGKTTLEGNSSIRFSGEWIRVEGLVFQNGSAKNVIEFRTSSTDYAFHSTVSECVVKDYNPADKTEKTCWLGLWGQYNTVEHCYFAGKNNQGTTFIVWPNDSLSQDNHHRIYRNYFGYRRPLGSNGGETIRIGTSQVSKSNSRTLLIGNYFEHCDGEVEIVSIKSCENEIVGNTFFECEGALVLRHGDRNSVHDNFFNGNGKKHTGGVRVVNAGHHIYNNLFYKLAGKEFRAALSIMNAIKETPLNGYHKVENVDIHNNTFVSCASPIELCVGKGFRDRDDKPENVTIHHNVVYCPTADYVTKAYDTDYDIRLADNVLFTRNGYDEASVDKNVSTAFWHDYFMPKASVNGVGADLSVLDGMEVATAQNCGPQWYIPEEPKKVARTVVKTWTLEPGTDVLQKTVKKAEAGDIIVLNAGEYVCTKKIKVDKSITICAANADAKPLLVLNGESTTMAAFEIIGDARLALENIVIVGDRNENNPAKYCFVTNKENAANYSLFLDGCEIYGFHVTDGGAVFKAYKSTFADSIVIRNCYLHDCYRGLALAEEKEEKGLYNAEVVWLENSVFASFIQWALDYTRLGQDESTSGGTLRIDHCVFSEVNDREDQTMLRQIGIKHVSLTNTIFMNSACKHVIRMSGKEQTADHCCVYLCGKITTSAGAKATNTKEEKPKFEKKSFRLSNKSSLYGAGADGDNIGLRK